MSDSAKSCQEVFDLLTPYLDRELDESEATLVKAHLDMCSHCASYFSFEASVLKLVKQKLHEPKMPEGLTEKILGAIPNE